MTDPAPRYTIEPYIGNSKPQWAIVWNHTRYIPSLRDVGAYPARSPVCIVDTEAEARALVEHMQRPAIAVE